MNEQELPSDSDASDDDYRPSGEDSVPPSEEESGSECEEVENNAEKTTKKNKSKKPVKRKSLKRKLSDDKINDKFEEKREKCIEERQLTEEEEKKKADDIWADFLNDCDDLTRKRSSLNNSSSSSSNKNGIDTTRNSKTSNQLSPSSDVTKPTVEEKENKQNDTQIFEFAGETIKVGKSEATSSFTAVNDDEAVNGSKGNSTIPGGRPNQRGLVRGGRAAGRGSALTSFLGQIGKKVKLSTLEKSKMDWDQFKQSEGIEEDVKQFNKGKDGYLERQDFLQRTDVRRFEIEKSLRQKRSGR